MPEKIQRKDRTTSHMLDNKYADKGYRVIYGLDEAGRGPWAGPLVAAAVALDWDNPTLLEHFKGGKDSKQMTPRQRVAASDLIRDHALAWGIGVVHAHEISEIAQMTTATIIAMQRALNNARQQSGYAADYLLIDYLRLPDVPADQQESFKQGESVSLSIAAASVLAKTWRDAYMIEMAAHYPEYGFESHKGYGTAAHRKALKQHGATPLHRRNYTPVAQAIAGKLI